MRVGLRLSGFIVAVVGALAPAAAQTCAKADFEVVVDEAAGALSALNQKNTPVFQTKLRQLKDKRGWSYDQFMTEAAPLVRDETIVGFDQKSEEMLTRIMRGGQSGASGAAPDCALLSELRGQMTALVEMQKAKWAYMFDRVEQALKK